MHHGVVRFTSTSSSAAWDAIPHGNVPIIIARASRKRKKPQAMNPRGLVKRRALLVNKADSLIIAKSYAVVKHWSTWDAGGIGRVTGAGWRMTEIQRNNIA